MKKGRHIIIGAGEVGKALFEVLGEAYSVTIRDIKDTAKGEYDVLHICFPPINNFVSVAKGYIKQYKPALVIVHSTVPVGTTAKLGDIAVHSPIRGVHPHLAEGVRTFVKYFGGKQATRAAKYFLDIGVPVEVFDNSETTEMLKILDTTYYGWNIVFAKEARRICDKMGLDFDEVYTMPNRDYNAGYAKLGMPQVVRPVLKAMSGKIGGHCVIQNTKLFKDWLTNTLRKRNEKY